jgi:pilus assembly protein CpaF
MSHGDSLHLQARATEVLKQHLAPIMAHLDDPRVQEVMINHPASIWIEAAGQYERLSVSISEQALISAITVLCRLNNKGADHVVDCRLPGLRIAATRPPIATSGPSMSIRRHSARTFELGDYLASGAFNPSRRPNLEGRPSLQALEQGGVPLVEFFRWLIQSRSNFVVSGATSSGKTAFLNALGQYIDPLERVITIEDTQELRLAVHNIVNFEANAALSIGIRDLVRHTLRYRPNRIWVGEIRGAEAFDALDAYNTGHPGSAVSFHSDTARAALSRLENMVRMAPEASNWPLADLRRQIAATFRFVIHCGNTNGVRGTVEIMEVVGIDQDTYQTQTLFQRY